METAGCRGFTIGAIAIASLFSTCIIEEEGVDRGQASLLTTTEPALSWICRERGRPTWGTRFDFMDLTFNGHL